MFILPMSTAYVHAENTHNILFVGLFKGLLCLLLFNLLVYCLRSQYVVHVFYAVLS